VIIFTIGHSTRSVEELLGILQERGVTQVIDVRRFPRSATNPQFNSDNLEAALLRAGLHYVHLEALGGRRSRIAGVDPSLNAGWEVKAFHNFADYAWTQPFLDGLESLLALASKRSSAVMCAEAVWWRCHRRIITDHLLARGVTVVHLGAAVDPTPASLTSFAVVGQDGRVSYPSGNGHG
jgi:uncharacterized protein (DUF488 family)